MQAIWYSNFETGQNLRGGIYISVILTPNSWGPPVLPCLTAAELGAICVGLPPTSYKSVSYTHLTLPTIYSV